MIKRLKKLLAGGVLLLTTGPVHAQCCGEAPSRVEFGDPFIMLHEDVYYAYGTSSDDGFEVFISDDLRTWRCPGGTCGGFVLHKEDVWGENRFWAPEVYHIDGKFHMYFSVAERIAVSVADSPLGPFRQEVKQPMIAGEQCIDNTLFIDDDGQGYIYFDRFDDGLNIWVGRLEENLITIRTETLTKCIAVSQQWETDRGRVNEGPFVFKHEGKYYMTYSANDYRSPQYGIGVAMADSPMGPWVKYEGNPILQNRWGLTGIGHSAMFRDKEGTMRIVFHAHKDAENIHPRGMHIGTVTFENREGVTVPVIGPDLLMPILQ